MRNSHRTHGQLLLLAVLTLGVMPGCFSLRNDRQELDEFLKVAANPSVHAIVAEQSARPPVMPVAFEQAQAPPRLNDSRRLNNEEIEPLRLSDAVRMALASTAIVRDRDDFLSPGSRLLNNPGAVASAFDVSLQETSAHGVEAALADFDAQVALGVQWGNNALIQGNRFATANVASSDILATNNGSVFARVDKPLDHGGVFSLIPNWNYTLNNFAGQSFNSRFVGFLRAEYRQPLLAGRGRDVTEIAGPLSYRQQGMRRGLAIARIDEHVSAVQFETQMQKLLHQTEDLYWDLWLAYQRYYSQAAAKDSAQQLWQRVRGRAAAGLEGGGAADEAEAKENFFDRQNHAENAQAEVFEAEARLRRLIGLPPNGVRVLRPADPPGQAQLLVDWQDVYTRALASRLELRKTDLWLRGLELQLVAATSLALPQLDLVTGLQANGLGDSPFGSGGGGGSSSFLDPDELGWNAGLEFSMPLGFRREKARIRNLEFQLAKGRAAVSAQRMEIGHELAHAIRNMQRWHASVKSTSDRLDAAKQRLAAVLADYDAGRTPLDRLVRSQVALAEAESIRAHSLAQFNKSLTEFHYRSGDLLSQHEIFLSHMEAMPANSSPAQGAEPELLPPQIAPQVAPQVAPPGEPYPLTPR